jgi:hypothetical protein
MDKCTGWPVASRLRHGVTTVRELIRHHDRDLTESTAAPRVLEILISRSPRLSFLLNESAGEVTVDQQ